MMKISKYKTITQIKLAFDEEDTFISSIKDMIDSGVAHNYVYFNPSDNDVLSADKIAEMMDSTIYSAPPEIYFKEQEFTSKIVLSKGADFTTFLTLTPIEPFKVKSSIDGKHSVDLAFYIKQVVNLCKDTIIRRMHTEIIG